MKVLITGASGQVGRALLKTRPNHLEVRALNHSDLEIGDSAAVRRAVQAFAPEVVINAAAYTAVDKAETEQADAILANTKGPQNLAEAVREVAGARLIQVSTDYVFDGGGTQPHRPDDPTGPISVYGQTKLVGEQVVREILGERAVILRTAWVYAAAGKNFVLTMLRLMKERGTVDVVADQRGSPTAASSVARALWRIVELPNVQGVLHWTDQGAISWYDFARAIAEDAAELGLLKEGIQVWPISTAEYPTPAQRPMNSVLDLRESAARLSLQPVPWRENLATTLRILASH